MPLFMYLENSSTQAKSSHDVHKLLQQLGGINSEQLTSICARSENIDVCTLAALVSSTVYISKTSSFHHQINNFCYLIHHFKKDYFY